MAKNRAQLTRLRLRESSGVDHPANHTQVGGEGWLVMKAAALASCATDGCPFKVLAGASKCAGGHAQPDPAAKAKDPKEAPMGNKTDKEQLAETAEELTKATARIAELEKAEADAKAAIAKAEADAAAAEAAKPAADKAAEVLAKALAEVPDVVKAALAKAQSTADEALAKAAAATDARLDAEYLAKAESDEFNRLPMEKAAFAIAFRKAAEAAPEAMAVVEAVLKGANAQLKASGLIKAIGDGGQDASDSWAAIEKAASELRVANPTMSQAQSIAKATELNPELVAEYKKELTSR